MPNAAGHYYYYDAPGFKGSSQGANDRQELRMNFHGWLRVSYNGTAPTGNTEAGTLVPGSLNDWCIALTVQTGGAPDWTWIRTTGDSPQVSGKNSVGPGQLDVNDPGQ